jgi:hypothetical protein
MTNLRPAKGRTENTNPGHAIWYSQLHGTYSGAASQEITTAATCEVAMVPGVPGATWYAGFTVSETTQFAGVGATGLTVSAGRNWIEQRGVDSEYRFPWEPQARTATSGLSTGALLSWEPTISCSALQLPQ